MLKTKTPRPTVSPKAVLRLFLACVIAGSLFAGCAVTGEKEIKQMDNTMSELDGQRQQSMRHNSPVRTHGEAYLGQYRMKIAQERDLPSFFSEQVVVAEKPLTLPQAASRIAQISGVTIELSPRLKARMEEKEEGSGQRREDQDAAMKMPLHFAGDLKGLLDSVASSYGVYWEWQDGRAYMFRLKTTTYDLTTGVGKVVTESRISNRSESAEDDEGGERGISGHQQVDHDYESNIWEKIVENIESMLSDEGRVVVTESAGNVSVTDTPSIHAEVGEYLNQVNDKLARQVAISVKVYSFRSTDTDDFGFSLKAAFEAASGDYSLGAESFTSNITSPSGLFNAAILEGGDEDSRLRKWEGSEAIVRALDEQGDVSLVTSGSGIVMNNQPLPIQNTKRVGYLKRSEISIGETATTAALESGTVSSGFSLNATPHILNNNEVVLQYNITLSELDDIKEIESGGSKIQTPEVSSRNFMQQVRMKMGETLFLAGFQSDSDQFSENKSAGGLFGWRKSGETVREMLLISITINEVDA